MRSSPYSFQFLLSWLVLNVPSTNQASVADIFEVTKHRTRRHLACNLSVRCACEARWLRHLVGHEGAAFTAQSNSWMYAGGVLWRSRIRQDYHGTTTDCFITRPARAYRIPAVTDMRGRAVGDRVTGRGSIGSRGSIHRITDMRA